MKNNVTRFAPSPTGHLHIGGARTAILSWIVAHKLSGSFLLRIEDTDSVRSTKEYADSILKSLEWLDIKYDNNPPIYQSDRYEHYKEIAHELVKSGLAYYCYSSQSELDLKRTAYEKDNKGGWKYDGKWRDSTAVPPTGVSPAIRLKVPYIGKVSWNDFIKGKIVIDNNQLDDFIILRSDGSPTYNFCVAVDDSDMGISHVIRGEDHIGNTPKQIYIYRALGKEVPIFGHVPLILNPNGTKMSKSDQAASLDYYKDIGILPEALTNYLLLMSCNNLKSEIMTREEFVNDFELTKLGNSPVKFDMAKLEWINQQYIKKLSLDDFKKLLFSQLGLDVVNKYKDNDWSLLQLGVSDRSKYVNDFSALVNPLLNWNQNGVTDTLVFNVLTYLLSRDNFTPTSIHDDLIVYASDNGLKFGDLMKPLRGLLFPDMKLSIPDALCFIGKDNLSKTLYRVFALKM